jgi:diguanylate cyclase (GGDEF)-like protein
MTKMHLNYSVLRILRRASFRVIFAQRNLLGYGQFRITAFYKTAIMNLRAKTLLTLSATLVVIIFLLYVGLSRVIRNSFLELETAETQQHVHRISTIITDTLTSQDSKNGDWANWDDAYRFMDDENPQFITENIPNNALTELNINALIFIKNDGRIVTEKYIDLVTGKDIARPEGLEKFLTADSKIIPANDGNEKNQGFVMLPQSVLMVTSRPVLTGQGVGPSRGTLILGRFLDAAELARISSISARPLRIERLDRSDQLLPSDFKVALSQIKNAGDAITIPRDDDTIFGYTTVNDIEGNQSLIVRTEMNRDIYHQGLKSLSYLVISLIILGLVTLLVIFILVNRLVLSRISILSSNVKDIGIHQSFSERVTQTGKDELGRLGRSINQMLGRLDHAHNSLTFERQQLLSIFEGIDEMIYVADPETYQILYANQVLKKQFDEDIVGKKCYQVIHGYYEPCSFCTNSHLFDKNLEIPFVYDHHNQRMNKWYHCIDRAIKWPDGRWVRHEIAIDITERKLAEERLEFLSNRDIMTGLFNRTYYETQLAILTEPPIGIIVCDVDGLKLINDTLGHAAGDSVLKEVAFLLKKCFRNHDMVCRIGGDEFAIILPDSTIIDTARAASRFNEMVKVYNSAQVPVPISISVGYSTSTVQPVALAASVKEADGAMYKNKLLQTRSARSVIVGTLLKTLEEHDEGAKGHAVRMNSFAQVLIKALELPSNQSDDIDLFARFHDIGKIGIPDSILKKPELLTEDEYRIMKGHVEIGSRIAASAPDLKHLAELIRHHHEWWNGGGYPDGLKGLAIPIECRILAIAEAFDDMTSERSYRTAMTVADACSELERCAGSQFDPGLVELFIKNLDAT